MAADITTQFKKSFLFPWNYKKWEDRFHPLSKIKKEAFVRLVNNTVSHEFAYQAIRKTNDKDLEDNFVNTLEEIVKEYIGENHSF